jgi:pyruvate dehydrogenase E1 component
MPENAQEGILRGIYRVSQAPRGKQANAAKRRVHLLGSGSILNEARTASTLLQEWDVAADVWSVTSYKELYHDVAEVERWNLYHPEAPRQSYLQEALAGEEGVFVAASDYLKVLPRVVSDHLPGPLVALGTDGFGRSETREELRAFFEVDAAHIAYGALASLVRHAGLDAKILDDAARKLGVDRARASAFGS